MPEAACPPLDALLARAAGRVRRRRVASGMLVAFVPSGITALALEMVRAARDAAGEPVFGHGFAFGAAGAVFAAGLAAAAAGAWARIDEERLARDVDLRLGLPDVAATTLALARGRATSPLAPWILAQSAPVLSAAGPRVDVAFAAEGPVRRLLRRAAALAAVAWIAAFLFLVADLLHWFDFGFGLLGRHDARDTGVIPRADPDVDRPVPAPRGSGPGGDTERERPAPAAEPPVTPPPGERPAPDPATPDVRATVRPARESFRETEPVLVVVSAAPTRDLADDRVLPVTLEVDGKDVAAGVALRVGPSAPRGSGEIVDLRRVPGLAARLGPGEHTVRAKMDDGAGREAASEPARFRIEGDPGGPGGGAQPPAPKPKPSPAPSPAPQAPPPPGERPAPQPSAAEPPPPPDLPVGFDPKTVLPLFGEGEEVRKQGPVVVLVPGGGPSGADVQRVPLAEAVPDAVRRAESQVDRGAVRPEDRDLVRRYFERLARGLR